MIEPKVERRARELVAEAATYGELWRHLSPATMEIIVQAVALDIQGDADIETSLAQRRRRQRLRARLVIEEAPGDSAEREPLSRLAAGAFGAGADIRISA